MDVLAITQATQRRLHKFNGLRGKSVKAGLFWDVVVLTAVDETQKRCYETQLKCKLEGKELPLSASYIVVPDPPGPKIGNGGSTFEVVHHLHKVYGEELWSKKIIIIHAGGFSQRLPNASLLGKAFMAIPFGEPLYQALELKLATYIDLPAKIHGGGMFVCCADTMEVYDDADIKWEFPTDGFSALAHMSPVSIGRTHGVFVLNSRNLGNEIVQSCRKFLHKPSVEKMETTENCVVWQDSKEKWVMTDSAFFISAAAAKLLLGFYVGNKPIKCEIDAYGDFLQALGTESTPDYVSNVENVCQETSGLVKARLQVYNLLKDSPLHAIVLASFPHVQTNGLATNQARLVRSIFFHMGTFAEYQHHFTADMTFRNIVGLSPLISCRGMPHSFDALEKGDSENSLVQVTKLGALSCSIKYSGNFATPCVMGSVFFANVTVGEGSIVEYCRLREQVRIGVKCVVSNCSLPARCVVPDNTFMHTAAIYTNHETLYVTVVFDVHDDLKKRARSTEAPVMLSYRGRPLNDVLSNGINVIPADASEASLWSAKLFLGYHTMEESCQKACEFLEASQKRRSDSGLDGQDASRNSYSMADIIKLKDVDSMLKFRQTLAKEISEVSVNSQLRLAGLNRAHLLHKHACCESP